jgi:EpsD family peptidyl-prolyl cis-trans isomerase
MNADTWCTLRTASTRHAVRSVAGACLAALTLAVGAGCCGPKEQPASQVAARVNKEEVTVHQINHALQTMRGLKPEQAEVAGSRILERLIDQELAIQKAQSLKLDRDPRVLQQIEAARDEIVARAYFDKIAEGVSRPTPEEVTAYYNDNPALFRERRVYQLQEVAIQTQAKGTQAEAIKRIVAAGKPLEDVLIHLRSNKIEYASNQVVRAAEQIPLATLPALSKLKNGQGIVIEGPAGIQVVSVVESRPQPIDEERARPAIEQFMVNDRKRRVVADDLKALRAASKVEYVGKFAASAPAAGDAVPSLADAAASAARGLPPSAAPAPAPAPAAAAKPATPGADAPAPASEGALENTIINKGLGLKK